MAAKSIKPKCSVCSEQFTTNAELVQHCLSARHATNRCCEKCSKAFGSKAARNQHVKASPAHAAPTTAVAPTPPSCHICTICNKQFLTEERLAQHSLMAGHVAIRTCDVCSKIFGSKQAVQDHCRSKHANNNNKKKTLKSTTSTAVKEAKIQAQASHASSEKHASLECRGNTYQRILSPTSQTAIFQRLLALRHNKKALKRHGYDATEGRTCPGQDAMPFPPRRTNNRRRAVVIDCEMAGLANGKSELISLTALDFFTCETLIHTLVRPQQPIADWRTGIHGISSATMSKGPALNGWRAARTELARFVDAETVLVGHSLPFDLAALRVKGHENVVDSAILACDAVFERKGGKPRYWGMGLKDLCKSMLGLKIREAGAPGSGDDSGVHDGLEDVLASRAVVLCCLERPGVFQAWVKGRQNVFFRKRPVNGVVGVLQQIRQRQKGKAPARDERSDANQAWEEDLWDSDDEELMWEDVVPWDVWPKSP